MNSKSKIQKQNKVKVPKRTRKFQYGDHIPRSEYDDGVLRNNHRATNRLSHEMQLYEKAHKVIMKDIGKESQMLRAKMSSTFLVTPRFDIVDTSTPSPALRMTNPFATSFGTPFIRMDCRTKRLQPIQLPNSSRNPRTNEKLAPLKVKCKGGKICNTNIEPVVSESPRLKSQSSTILLPRRKLEQADKSEARSGSVANSKTGFRSDSEMSIIAIVNETNKESRGSRFDGRLSRLEGRGSKLDGRVSKLDSRGRLDGSVSKFSEARAPSSRASFIEILKEAEEKRARELDKYAKVYSLSSGNDFRPKTPKPMSNYDDNNDNVFEEPVQEKTGLLKATPNATYVNIPS